MMKHKAIRVKIKTGISMTERTQENTSSAYSCFLTNFSHSINNKRESDAVESLMLTLCCAIVS